MLRSWTDRLQLYVGPGTVSMLRISGPLRPRVIARHAWQAEATGRDDWQGALAELAATLQLPEWQQASVQVRLSSSLAPLRLSPWESRLTPGERAAMLRHRYSEIHGEALKHALVAVADVGYGRAGLAAAADPRLIEALQATCGGRGLRLRTIQPLWMAAFNRWRREIGTGDAWLLLAEPETLTLGLLQGGAWAGIRTQPAVAGWENDLEARLSREAFYHGVEAGAFPLFVMHPQRPAFRPSLPGRTVHPLRVDGLPGFSTEGDRDVALAMV